MTRAITGATRVVAVIGDPVTHSLSPLLHNAAFEALGLDWVYVAFPVAQGRGGDAVRAVPTLGLAGLNVTMPHKADAAAACDELTPDAAALRSVNTVVPLAGGKVLGDSTDGEGFVRSLLAAGCDPEGREVAVLGAGGAARAVARALGRRGARVAVAARRPEAAAEAVATAGDSARAILWPEIGDALAEAEIVVNATPIGMGGEGIPLDPGLLRGGQVVVDLVYHPRETPLLAAARAAGAQPVDGLGMLVHQAALAFERWTGRPAPVEAMREALPTT